MPDKSIEVLEYTTNGCLIKSIRVPVYTRNNKEDKERIVFPKAMEDRFSAPRQELTVLVIREEPDPEAEGVKFIQQLNLTYWVDNTTYSVGIAKIREDIMNRYGYSREEANMFNVASITFREHYN